MAGTFLERHYANAAPQRSRLNQRKELRQRLENYIVNSARMHEFKACWKVATARGGRRFFARAYRTSRSRLQT
jgi:DNA/RNA endonuclease G (NUC1)